MSQPDECPIAASARAPRSADASSPSASAQARSCSGAKLRPAARSEKSAALTAWLRVRISRDNFLPALAQRGSAPATRRLPNNAPPTRSSPEGVRPAPRPNSGRAATTTASASSRANALVNARTSGIARSSGNCGFLRARSAPNPPGLAESAIVLCSLRAPETTRSRRIRSSLGKCGVHALRGIDSKRSSRPRISGLAIITARGCSAGSREPIQTISRSASYHGDSANAASGRATPPLRSSARRARSPIAAILSPAPCSAAACPRSGRPRRTTRSPARRRVRPSSRASRHGSARSRKGPRRRTRRSRRGSAAAR